MVERWVSSRKLCLLVARTVLFRDSEGLDVEKVDTL